MYLKILLTLLTSILPKTAQTPDILFFNGNEYQLFTNPLEPYFEKYPEKRPEGTALSTGLWRGYIASFDIKVDSLFVLKDIVVENWSNNSIKLHSVKKKIFGDTTVLINWFSGLLVIPDGEQVNYVHMGYGSEYERYKILEIKKGIFKNLKEFTHREYVSFKRKQLEAYKRTAEYIESYDDLKKKGHDENTIEEFLESFIIEYSSKFLIE